MSKVYHEPRAGRLHPCRSGRSGRVRASMCPTSPASSAEVHGRDRHEQSTSSAATSSACRWRTSTQQFAAAARAPPRPSGTQAKGRARTRREIEPMTRDKRAGADAGVGPTGFPTGAMPRIRRPRRPRRASRLGDRPQPRLAQRRRRVRRRRVRAAVCAHRARVRPQAALAGGIGLVGPRECGRGGRRRWPSSSVHIVHGVGAAPWCMRFGQFNRVAGPGLVFTWPVIEFYTRAHRPARGGHLLRRRGDARRPTWCP